MRLDRLLTLSLVQPIRHTLDHFRGTNAQPSAAGPSLPILMYHNISDEPEPGSAAYYKTCTSPAVFQQQMRHLAEDGFHAIDLFQAVKLMRGGARLPEKCVVITFDDGYRSFYTEAFPILQEHKFAATVFLPTGSIRTRRTDRSEWEPLIWGEVLEMRKGGIGFGSHTVSHPELIKLSWADIERELRDSKSEIEQQLAEPITAFSYPYTFPQNERSFNGIFRELLVEAGYACCVTTEIGCARPADDPYRLKRLPVNSCDDEALLTAKLEGGYDWLGLPQAIKKGLKRQTGSVNGRNGLHHQTPHSSIH